MTVIVVDAAAKAELLAGAREVELRDEAGTLLARAAVQPPRDERLRLTRLAEETRLSEDELARRLAPDAVTYTTEEVLAYVKGRRK